VLETAGNATLGVGDTVGTAATPVSATSPATTSITGTIVNVAKDTGDTLVDTGNGKQVLVSGLLGAVGDAVQISALNTPITTATSGNGLVGAGVASATQPTGTLATLGVLTDGKTATATINGLVLPVSEVTPGALANIAQVTAANTTLGGTAGTTPLVGVAALSGTPATGKLASATVLPTNGAATATVNAPVVGQAVSTVASAAGSATGGANGLVGVTAGTATIGATNPVVGANVTSATPVTGTLATVTVPATAVIGSATGATATPSVTTPVAVAVAPVVAVVAPVTSGVLPSTSVLVAPVVTPTTAPTASVAKAVGIPLGPH
jgi:hypothetical protein